MNAWISMARPGTQRCTQHFWLLLLCGCPGIARHPAGPQYCVPPWQSRDKYAWWGDAIALHSSLKNFPLTLIISSPLCFCFSHLILIQVCNPPGSTHVPSPLPLAYPVYSSSLYLETTQAERLLEVGGGWWCTGKGAPLVHGRGEINVQRVLCMHGYMRHYLGHCGQYFLVAQPEPTHLFYLGQCWE